MTRIKLSGENSWTVSILNLNSYSLGGVLDHLASLMGITSAGLAIISLRGPFSLFQGETEYGSKSIIYRWQSNPPEIRFEPDDTGSYTGSMSFRQEASRTVYEIAFQWKRPLQIDQRYSDNHIDRQAIDHPEEIDAGKGRDTVISGSGDDTITGGLDDDIIDLSTSIVDQDIIEYRVKSAGNVFIAFDGGDEIKGFSPGMDVIAFMSDDGEQAFDLLTGLGSDVIVMPIIVFAPRQRGSPDLDTPLLTIWANYRISGLEFHFREAVVLPSGRITGSILTLEFVTDDHFRGDRFLTLAGDDFDLTYIKIINRNLVEDLLSGEFGFEDIVVHERHPLNKPVYQLMLEPGETASLPAGLYDNDLFRLTEDGRLLWKNIIDYETPMDRDHDQFYQVKIARTGSLHQNRITVEVQDILQEKDPSYIWLTGADIFDFTPHDIPDGNEPGILAKTLISGEAYIMPVEGPLILTWSLDHVSANSLLKTQADIDQARKILERAFAEYESVINVKFVEVHHHGDPVHEDFYIRFVIGDLLITGASNGVVKGRGQITYIYEHLDNVEYSTVVHEIGHSLGLKHPFTLTSQWPGDANLRFAPWSVMSYAYDRPDGLGAVDIEALQFLYGRPGTNWHSPERFFQTSPASIKKIRQFDASFNVEENIGIDAIINDDFDYDSTINSDGNILQRNFLLWAGRYDNDLFAIDKNTGAFSFKTSPDYENPHDGMDDPKFGGNNIYQLLVTQQVKVNDPGYDTIFTSLFFYDFLVEVTDVEEAPIIPDIL